jgi:hypothetical protein
LRLVVDGSEASVTGLERSVARGCIGEARNNEQRTLLESAGLYRATQAWVPSPSLIVLRTMGGKHRATAEFFYIDHWR